MEGPGPPRQVVSPEGVVEPSDAEKQRAATPSPSRRRVPKGWVPWAIIVGVVAIALAVALPLTLDGSPSSASPTPRSPTTTGPGAASDPQADGISGTYFTPTVTLHRLVFLSLLRTGSTLKGKIAVTDAGTDHKHLVTHTHTFTGRVTGTAISLTVAPSLDLAVVLSGTYQESTASITLTVGSEPPVVFKRGTLATYRILIRQDRSSLLS